MTPARRILTIIIAALAFAFTAPPVSADATASSRVIKKFQDSLIEVMKESATTDVRQRFERLAPEVDAAFHLPAMVHIILGPRWDSTSPEDRQRLIASFRRMSITTLATLFDGYNGEEFEIIGEKPGPQGTLLVETVIRQPGESPIDIAFAMKEFQGGGWRAIDVVLDRGISELNVRRSEYNRILQSGGLEALIRALDGKADELLAAK